MSRKQCITAPWVNNSPSELYLGLSNMPQIKYNRPLIHYIYAWYASNKAVQDAMDNKGLKRNKQGQHSAQDVFNFLDMNSFIDESSDIQKAEFEVGAIDPHTYRPIDYSNGKQVYEICDDYNGKHRGVVAYPVKKGTGVYNIEVKAVDANTNLYRVQVQQSLAAWNVVEHAFNSIGIDINDPKYQTNLYVNPDGSKGLMEWLQSVALIPSRVLSLKDVQFLLNLNEKDPIVQRLVTRFGSIEEVANQIYTMYHDPNAQFSNEDIRRLATAIDHSQKGININFQQVIDDINKAIGRANGNWMTDLAREAQNLRQYGHDLFKTVYIGDTINSLSDISNQAIITMKRQLELLEAEKGIESPEYQQLSKQYQRVQAEFAGKRFFNGAVRAVTEAEKILKDAFNAYINDQTTGTIVEVAQAKARLLKNLNDALGGYKFIVEGASNIRNLTIDEVLSAQDQQALEDYANEVKKTIQDIESIIERNAEHLSTGIFTELLGIDLNDGTKSARMADGTTIANLVAMKASEGSIMDTLYSAGRVSNPLIGAIGGLIRSAQNERNDKGRELDDRRVKALYKLRQARKKAGDKVRGGSGDTSFMYDADMEHLISDIDWEAYNKARAKHEKALKKQGYDDLDLKLAMLQWEQLNTEERIVDKKNGRTERVPDTNYRTNALDRLSAAEREYYDTMMQIKGEIGTMMPEYAKDQYRAPQIRRGFIDALSQAKREHERTGKSLVHIIWNDIKTQIKKGFKVNESDTDLYQGDIAGSSQVLLREVDSNLKGEKLRRIPIYHFTKLEDKNELLLNFDQAISSLYKTAINYDCLSKIEDLVNFMADRIRSKINSASVDDQEAYWITRAWNTIKMVKNKDPKIIEVVLNSAIESQLYNIRSKGMKAKQAKLVKSLLYYNSMKSLSTNSKGQLSNLIVGYLQNLIEAAGGRYFGWKDIAYGTSMALCDATFGAGKRMKDFFTGNKNSKALLLSELFDSSTSTFNELGTRVFHSNFFRRVWSKDFKFLGYQIGEYFIHKVNMYSMLHGTKIMINGKTHRGRHQYNLEDAFEVVDTGEGSSELRLKQGCTYLIKDSKGNYRQGDVITMENLTKGKRNFRQTLRQVNQNCHGSMTQEDYGAVQQYVVGKMIMQFRQWMVEHFSRRWRSLHWDADLERMTEGYSKTLRIAARDWLEELILAQKDMKTMYLRQMFEAMQSSITKSRQNRKMNLRTLIKNAESSKDLMSAEELEEYKKDYKANLRRAGFEIALLGALYILKGAAGDPKDHKEDWVRRQMIYQIRRAIVDEQASIWVPGLINESETILNSPVSGVKTLDGMLYPMFGLMHGDVLKEYEKGNHLIKNKYLDKSAKAYVPFYGTVEKEQDFLISEGVFNVMQ